MVRSLTNQKKLFDQILFLAIQITNLEILLIGAQFYTNSYIESGNEFDTDQLTTHLLMG